MSSLRSTFRAAFQCCINCLLLACSTTIHANSQAHWQFITAVGDTELWPNPPFTLFDVYIDGVLAADNIDDLSALPMTEHAAGTLSVAIAPNSSSSAADAFVSLPFELADGDSVAAILVGFLNPSNHPPNPDGLDTSMRLLRVPNLREEPRNSGRMEMRLVHATPFIEPFALVDNWPTPTDTSFTSGGYGSYDDYRLVEPDSGTTLVNYWAIGLNAGSHYCFFGHDVRAGAYLAVTSGYAVNHIGLFNTAGERIIADGSCPVGIADSDERNTPDAIHVDAYPNPATSFVTIRVTPASRGTQTIVELYDTIGRRIGRRSFAASGDASNEIRLDVSSLPRGVYYVQVTYASRFETPATATTIVLAR